jgi:UPF0176 protein
MSHQVLLYYNYTPIENPEELVKEQKELCLNLGLKGRILIAHEGINGTLEGTVDNAEKYVESLLKDIRFKNTHIKKSESKGDSFPKLVVKVRDEIVSGHLGEWDVNPAEITGKHITAEELHDWIHSDKEFYIVDMRNDYEHKSGHFKNSILPKLGHFRDLPKIIPEIAHLKNKTIVTVCTGGVRCEKASGFLVKHGFTDVYQLYGGIVTYMEKYPNEDFLGKLYVFDNRILMGFNTDSVNHIVVGQCDLCGLQSENYVNCANDECHVHFIACAKCVEKTDGKVLCGNC